MFADFILVDEKINELIKTQLDSLKNKGAYELYMYLVEKYGIPVADEDGYLFYEILTNDFRGNEDMIYGKSI